MNANQLVKQQFESEDCARNAMYLAGGYDMCKRLLTSPRFNKPQREIIEEQAVDWRERAEHQGLTFTESADAS